MAAGLQVWDANGNLLLDGSTSLVKFFGRVSIGDPGSGNGSVNDDRYSLVSAGKARFFYMLLPSGDSGLLLNRPTIALSGNSVTWTWNTSDRISCFLVYGIY